MTEIKVLRTVRAPLQVGWSHLVGHLYAKNEWPRPVGNECSLRLQVDGKTYDYKCLNMCAENIAEVKRRWPEVAASCEIDLMADGSSVIADERIPPEWRYFLCDGCWHYAPIDHECRQR